MAEERRGSLVAVRDTRERVIARLSDAFAHDELELEEFERRLGVAHRSESLVQLEELGDRRQRRLLALDERDHLGAVAGGHRGGIGGAAGARLQVGERHDSSRDDDVGSLRLQNTPFHRNKSYLNSLPYHTRIV